METGAEDAHADALKWSGAKMPDMRFHNEAQINPKNTPEQTHGEKFFLYSVQVHDGQRTKPERAYEES